MPVTEGNEPTPGQAPPGSQTKGTGGAPKAQPKPKSSGGGGGGGAKKGPAKKAPAKKAQPNRNRNKNRNKQKTDGTVTNRRGKPIKQSRLRNLAADYGWAWSVLEDNPQLFQIFEQAVENTWSPQRFIAEVQDTRWFKNHSDSWREAYYLERTDPKTFNKRVNEIQQQIADAAGSLGIDVDQEQLTEWATQALRFGWQQEKINNVLANQVKIRGKHEVGGGLRDAQNRLETFAWANGVHVNKGTMQGWLRNIVRGNGSVEEFERYIEKQAIAKFPNWAKQLQAGMTMAEIAEPYRQTMAQLLEVNPADIGLFDSMLGRALSQKNDKGEYESMTLSDFEDQVRKDPRWQYTDNAHEEVAGITASLLQTFGMMA